MIEKVSGIYVMHSKIVLPAIEAARKALADQIRTHKDMAAQLKPGQSTLSFDPYTQSPGQTEVPQTADDFRFWELPEESFSTFMLHLAINMDGLMLKHSAFQKLPPGYRTVRYVLRFETHCKFSSWLAIENVGQFDMEWTRDSYRRIGLDEEAGALELAEKAWYDANGHEGNGYDEARDAYQSVENPYQDEDERWFHILNILRDSSFWSAPR